MYQSIGQIHSNIGKRQTYRPRLAKSAATPIVNAPVTPPRTPKPVLALALPSLESITAKYEVRYSAVKTAKTLLSFMDLGLVEEADLEQPWTTETEILNRSFSRWVERQGHGLEIFHPCITVGDSQGLLGYDPANVGVDDDKILFSFTSCNMEYFTIGEKAAEIEKSSSGLGETLLYHLGRSLFSTLISVFPESALDYARHLYWMGSDNENDYIEELILNGENPDDCDVFRRADFFADMPEWAGDPKEKLSARKLKGLVKNSDGMVKKAAQIALELHSVNSKEGYHPPAWEDIDYADCLDPAAIIQWADGDAVERVYDDFYAYASNGECSDCHGYYGAKPDVHGIGKVLENIKHFFEILRVAEKALILIAVKQQ